MSPCLFSVPKPSVCAVVHFQKEKTQPALGDSPHGWPAFHLVPGFLWGLDEEWAELPPFPSSPPGSRGTPALGLIVCLHSYKSHDFYFSPFLPPSTPALSCVQVVRPPGLGPLSKGSQVGGAPSSLQGLCGTSGHICFGVKPLKLFIIIRIIIFVLFWFF